MAVQQQLAENLRASVHAMLCNDGCTKDNLPPFSPAERRTTRAPRQPPRKSVLSGRLYPRLRLYIRAEVCLVSDYIRGLELYSNIHYYGQVAGLLSARYR